MGVSLQLTVPDDLVALFSHKKELTPEKKYHRFSKCSNFFVFQSYVLRFSGFFCLDLKRSFPGSFVFLLISGESTHTQKLLIISQISGNVII